MKAEFLEHANEEVEHADRIAQRIVELRGAPDFSPDGPSMRSHAEYVEADSLKAMIRENLVAERIAIDSYSEIVNFVKDTDPAMHKLLREIFEAEEEYAKNLASLLENLPG